MLFQVSVKVIFGPSKMTFYFIPVSVPMLPQTGTTGGGPGGKSGGKASKQVPGKLQKKTIHLLLHVCVQHQSSS